MVRGKIKLFLTIFIMVIVYALIISGIRVASTREKSPLSGMAVKEQQDLVVEKKREMEEREKAENEKYIRQKISMLADKYIGNTGYEVYIGVYNLDKRIYAGYNDDIPFYPASLTKPLYMAAFLKKAEKEGFSLDQKYILKEEDKYVGREKVEGTGILQGESPGETYTYNELLYFMMCYSDNVAANIILERTGFNEVNRYCFENGLKLTHIYRKYYEMSDDKPSNQTTARDLTIFLAGLVEDADKGDEVLLSILKLMQKNTDKNRIPRYLSPELTIANKTGTVPRLVGDMAVIYFPDRAPFVLTIIVCSKDKKEINLAQAEEIIACIARDLLK
ncbi:serine hydrolase [Thermosyntropha sp.]|uniref:serine hydrolase n=1 Tax=Thermosyntropha sp. TaxID=2740820 RepID=UPI0025DAC5FA|nr:serine hydrolase [Thermosyntropha sp.]MBO8159613.1 serine hydrolase [Thermosyntropha sp.]